MSTSNRQRRLGIARRGGHTGDLDDDSIMAYYSSVRGSRLNRLLGATKPKGDHLSHLFKWLQTRPLGPGDSPKQTRSELAFQAGSSSSDDDGDDDDDEEDKVGSKPPPSRKRRYMERSGGAVKVVALGRAAMASSSGSGRAGAGGLPDTGLCKNLITHWAGRLCASQAPEAFQQLRGIGFVAAQLLASDDLRAAVDSAPTKKELCRVFSEALGGVDLPTRRAEVGLGSPWVDPMTHEMLRGDLVIPLSAKHHRENAGAALENVSAFNADTLPKMGRGRRTTGFRVDPMATRRSTHVRDMVADHRRMLGLGEDDDDSDEEDGGAGVGGEGLAAKAAEARAIHAARVAEIKKQAAALREAEDASAADFSPDEKEEEEPKRIRVAFLDGETAPAEPSSDWAAVDFGIGGERRARDPSVRSGCVADSHGKWIETHRETLDGLVGTVSDYRHAQVLHYKPHDFFKEHIDKKLGKDHIGTALLVCPKPGTKGGVLVDCENGVCLPEDRCYAAYIPHGVRHKVEPVTEGERIVGKAEVYEKGAPDDLWTKRQRWVQGVLDTNGGKWPEGTTD